MNILLAAEGSALNYAWILDIVFFLALVIGAAVGAKLGFVKSVLKVSGWLLAVLIPFMFCTPVAQLLEQWFGLKSILQSSVGNPTIASWLTVGIAFAGMFVVVRLLTWLLGLFGTKIADSTKATRVINHVLGSIVVLAVVFCILMTLLVICSWLNIEGANDFINASFVVGPIYRSDLMTLLPNMIGEMLPQA